MKKPVQNYQKRRVEEVSAIPQSQQVAVHTVGVHEHHSRKAIIAPGNTQMVSNFVVSALFEKKRFFFTSIFFPEKISWSI